MIYLLAIAITAVVVFSLIVYTLKNLLYVATPNQLLVLAGGRHRAGERETGYRAVRGGRAVRVPLLETVAWMDLSNIPVQIEVKHAFSKGGIPLNVHGVAQVKLPGSEPRLHNAVERFLGRGQRDIAMVARETLEGNVRGVVAQLTPEQVNQDKIAFANHLLEEAEHDFARIGLVLDTLKIQNVTDDVNYLNSTSRIQGAAIRRDATIAEAKAQAQAATQKADNWCQAEIAKINANLAIARKEIERRVKDAVTGREAKIAGVEGQIRGEIAQIQEDINRQTERAKQVEQQLDAEVVQPAVADKRKLEESARAAAALILSRGQAEAAALAKLVEQYRAAGHAAREVLVLQQLMPMLAEIAGSARPTRIQQWTVLQDAGGDGLAHKAVRFNEQLRAATGVDLVKTAARIAETTPKPRPEPRTEPPPLPHKDS